VTVSGERRLADFRVHGPFPLATIRNSHRREVERRGLGTFWNQKQCSVLAERSGCYVFAIRTTKRYIPYYVGQTGVGFTRECFTRRNLELYDRALARHGKSAYPVLFLLCGGSRKVKRRIIGDIETFFIQLGADRNPHFLNVKGRPLPRWRVPGVIRSRGGKPSQAARHFRKAFDL
jgi:hypothetical protein